MPTLRVTGIIDKDSKPTELAIRWRDDAQYPSVCNEIRQVVYPQELLDLAPDPSVSRQAIQTWFANHTGVGESGARKMAAFYGVLLDADPTKQAETSATPAASLRTPARAQKASPSVKRQPAGSSPSGASTTDSETQEGDKRKSLPDFNINVQIHIAADAKPEQIDQIFASMAKHLKEFA